MRLADIAQKLGCRLEGPPELEIRGVAGIEHAEAGEITFLANRGYFSLLKKNRASAGLVEEGNILERKGTPPAPSALRPRHPHFGIGQAVERLSSHPPQYA